MASSSTPTAKPGYMLSRGFTANTRIALQHYLWKDGLNYLLHPSIPTTSKDLKIAEIGVGTGIWLIELARTLPPTVQLDGLDISFGQCPPKEWLPQNIAWVTHDAFSEPPEELLEKYDVIHVQLFITLIRDGNPVPMLKNLIKMLKPGGYISWGEWDVATWEVIRIPSAPSQTNEELNELREYTSTLGKTRPGPSFISSGWITRLHQTFAENGLSNVIVDRHKFSTEIATLLLDTWMVASQEISANILDGLGGGQGDVARALVEEVGKNRGNTAFNLERVITIGQKPLK
ncbi:S-adenosyl-L-methionine-dependent methyltransferase [Venustampulla echinocandica]|uniref:S-adenosyl-L-methionine-dependent methyltransferase n=1 Tax=Venustampulla echinocandica TaxID=2656787 RepID=A0A370U0K8_9HELO|nr:S-adenosyl-L-methionine-dependent methyltransferase [Venustampulla echinocandica]RDL41293.1 S-adenosyl-L-methionine-dependent methyltransferase [Venustampulla echinocandica]